MWCDDVLDDDDRVVDHDADRQHEPNSVSRLIVKPSAAIAAKAPMIVTGTVVAGTSMARQSCRNTRITISTRTPASISVL